ncbi:hypothetical protein H2199_007287 [Coniosporium tulheliwenetii]|uniref:Uncharacterized protein n=1 Tax=Coniosporium tulheliwenetii TaxID=3383036 RepID=A0ACC2YQU9_9PEZI|nr:hypothetical protein H2199_007287 [Cladosporium sp. JES 115]
MPKRTPKPTRSPTGQPATASPVASSFAFLSSHTLLDVVQWPTKTQQSRVSAMPPKRRPPARQASPEPPTKKRASKLAKEHGVTAAQEAEIREAWKLFAREHSDYPDEKEGVLEAGESTRPHRAPASVPEILDTLDPESDGWIPFSHFFAYAALRLLQASSAPDHQAAEIDAAFALFTEGSKGKKIKMSQLRRIANQIKEEVGDDVLRDMILEANGGAGVEAGVGREEFEGVMRRAGVFG